jgi:hypothetical protein
VQVATLIVEFAIPNFFSSISYNINVQYLFPGVLIQKRWKEKAEKMVTQTCIDRVKTEQFEKIDSFIEFLKNSSDTLRKTDTLAVLHQAYRICGSLPKEIQYYIADKLDVCITEIEQIISFYEYFSKATLSENIDYQENRSF